MVVLWEVQRPLFVGNPKIFEVMENHVGNLFSSGWGKSFVQYLELFYKFEIASKNF